MGLVNKILYKWSRSHDQYGCHAHNGKNLKKLLLWHQKADDFELVCSIGYLSTTKLIQMMTLG